MTNLHRIAYLLWPLSVLALSAVWGLLLHGNISVHTDWYDTEHYAAIAEFGYSEAFRSAFFPAFPFFWGALGIPAWAMGLVNALIWLASLVWLERGLRLQRRALVMASVIPSIVFFAIPYSESLFFLFTVMVAYGLHKNNLRISVAGMLLAAFVRPTAVVILPALFVARWFSGEGFKPSLGKTAVEALAGLLAVIGVFYVQSLQTGEFFGFFSAQSGWGNGFGLPKLPFTSWGGDVITMYDGVALFVGLFAGRTLWHTRRGGLSKLSAAERFGLAGLFFTALLIVFTRDGALFSLNRFVFATAFFPLALSGWANTVFQKRELPLVFVAWLLFSLLLKSYAHVVYFSYFLGAGVLIVAVLRALKNQGLRWLTLLVLVVASSAVVTFFYFADRWIG